MEKESSGGPGTGFAIGALVVILLLAVVGAGTNKTKAPETSTGSAGTGGSPTETTAQYAAPRGTTGSTGGTGNSLFSLPTRSSERRLSNDEIERKVERLYMDLNSLSKEVRDLSLRSPASPYAGRVDLRTGNARDTNPIQEYVTISAERSNTADINISGWYLESVVTEERAAIPQGDRILERWRYPVAGNITLAPGEDANIITRESPIDTSFRENMCTGYLAAEADFYPWLSRNCPAPLDDMKRFGNIKLDDDSCYDFVERLSRCVPPDEDAVDAADLSHACTNFLESTLGHNNCVTRHRYDPFFDNPGGWFVYLDRDEDLWRQEREIIRLIDENDRVIDYVEY